MRGNWLFWLWKNQNVKIWPWNLIFKNVSLIVACNILNWSMTCLRSYKCIYATTTMKINLATMGGITVITQYVSVCVCVSTRLYYSTILSNVDGLLQNLKVWYPDMVLYLPLQAISGTYVKVAEMLNLFWTHNHRDFWYLAKYIPFLHTPFYKLCLWKCDTYYHLHLALNHSITNCTVLCWISIAYMKQKNSQVVIPEGSSS